MKTKVFALALLATTLTLPSLHAADIFFGISDDHHHPRHHHYRYETCHRPVIVVEDEPTVVVRETPPPIATPNGGVPYGYMQGGMLKSPWSDFTMSVGGKASGQIVYDPSTGQPFRIP